MANVRLIVSDSNAVTASNAPGVFFLTARFFVATRCSSRITSYRTSPQFFAS